jgi:hypothetical protein
LEKPKEVYLIREADILAHGSAMSTEKKNEKWKTFSRVKVQNTT